MYSQEFILNFARALSEAPKYLHVKTYEGKELTEEELSQTIHRFGDHTPKGFKTVLAGGLAGGIEMLLTYPTEYVKTQLQLDEKGERQRYKGILDCIQKSVKRHGVRGLYHGMSPLLYGAIPKVGVRFTVYEFLKQRMYERHHGAIPMDRFLCGLATGVFEAIVIVIPIETMKVKLIHDQRRNPPRYKGFFHGIATILQEKHGLRSIYKGVTPTVLKQGTNHAIRFAVMESFRDLYTGGHADVKVPKWVIGSFGLFAGSASVTLNAPFDVLKTRMQGLDSHKYKNTWDCAVKIAKLEGPLAFYRGTAMRLIGVCLNVPIIFMLYDTFMDIFNKIWP